MRLCQCFNCNQLSHYANSCSLPNRRATQPKKNVRAILEDLTEEEKYEMVRALQEITLGGELEEDSRSEDFREVDE